MCFGVGTVGWNTKHAQKGDHMILIILNVLLSHSLSIQKSDPLTFVLIGVLILGSGLPQMDEDDYQFCYIDSSRQVKGASTPFSFRNPTDSSLDYSLDTDILVVATQVHKWFSVYLQFYLTICTFYSRE